MALFFDAPWFNAQLARLHLPKSALGPMLGLTETGLAELWKDQRELKATDVAVLAALFNVAPADIAARAGISTPVPRPAAAQADIIARLDRIEALLQRLVDGTGGA
jgi:hypothetical protein